MDGGQRDVTRCIRAGTWRPLLGAARAEPKNTGPSDSYEQTVEGGHPGAPMQSTSTFRSEPSRFSCATTGFNVRDAKAIFGKPQAVPVNFGVGAVPRRSAHSGMVTVHCRSARSAGPSRLRNPGWRGRGQPSALRSALFSPCSCACCSHLAREGVEQWAILLFFPTANVLPSASEPPCSDVAAIVFFCIWT